MRSRQERYWSSQKYNYLTPLISPVGCRLGSCDSGLIPKRGHVFKARSASAILSPVEPCDFGSFRRGKAASGIILRMRPKFSWFYGTNGSAQSFNLPYRRIVFCKRANQPPKRGPKSADLPTNWPPRKTD